MFRFSVLFWFLAVILTGCGGGGSGSTVVETEAPVQLAKIDLQSAEAVKLTPQNAPELLSLAQLYLPADMGLSRYDYQEILQKKGTHSQKCSNGGRVNLVSLPSDSRVVFDFQGCREGATLLEGQINIVFDSPDIQKADGYFYTRDFRISASGVTLQYSYDITLQNKPAPEINNYRQVWHYDVEVVYVEQAESLRYVLDIEETDSNRVSMQGTYLLPDNTYFELSAQNLSSPGNMALFGTPDEDFFGMLMGNEGAYMTVLGNNSRLIYSYIEYNKPFYALVVDEQKNEVIYAYANVLEWTDDLTQLGLENHPVVLERIVLNADDSRDIYGMYDRLYHHFYTYRKENTLVLKLTDDQYDLPYYKINMSLIHKPATSVLQVGAQIPVQQEEDIDNTNGFYHHMSAVCQVALDAEGMYVFALTIVDGKNTIEQKVIVEYYDPVLPESMKRLDFAVKKAMYIPSLKQMVYLTTEQLIFDDLKGGQNSFSVDLLTWDMDLNEAEDQIILAQEEGIAVLDITAYPSIRLKDKYLYPEESIRFQTVDVIGEYAYCGVYTLDFSSEKRYRIRLSDGKIMEEEYTQWSYSHLFTNRDKTLLYDMYRLSYYTVYTLADAQQFDSSVTGDISSISANYSLFDIIAQYDPDHIVFADGAMYRLGTPSAPYLVNTGYLQYLTLEDSYVYNALSDIPTGKTFAYFDATETKYMVVNTVNNDYRQENYSHFDESRKFGEDTLNIFSKEDQSLLYQKILKKFIRDRNGEILRLKVRKIKFLSDDQIYILYRAYKEGSNTSTVAEDLGIGYYFYEIQKI